MNKFISQLNKLQQKNQSLLCVGLDTVLNQLPKHSYQQLHTKSSAMAMFAFNRAIIEATHDVVCAYKPNIAFYEAEGLDGLKALQNTTDFLRQSYPHIPIILDAKRGDIGHTNAAYARAIFEELGVDAVTLHPYLGKVALKPFLKLKDKFYFILCRTSNPGAGEFQDLKVNRQPLYQYLAKLVAKDWNKHGNCGLVVGATYPEELAKIRAIAPEMTFLVPGIGKQGGDLAKTVKAGQDKHGRGMVINSSRGIIYASQDKDFAEAAREAARKLNQEINQYRKSA